MFINVSRGVALLMTKSDWNISTSSRYIAVEDIHGLQRIMHDDFDDPLTFKVKISISSISYIIQTTPDKAPTSYSH